MFLQPVVYEVGQDNMAGIFGKIFAAPTSWIANIPAPVNGEIVGDITMKSGYNFVDVYHTQGTGRLDFEGQGERDGGSLKNSVEWNVPALKGDNLAFANAILNGPYIVLCFDADGNCFMLGSIVYTQGIAVEFPAYRETLKGTTGMKATDVRGVNYKMTADTPKSPYVYKGDIAGLLLPPPAAYPASSIASTTVVANWSAVSGATAYLLDVSEDENFTSFVAGYNALEVTGTTETITGLTANRPYFYRVRSKTAAVVSSPSNAMPFATAP
jgi:hypothetical protein